ncbi:conserved hypothetical protein, PP_1857 family [Roseateles sp. YR242]|uniref:elongation factor P maturation arginine rhamnosyltransferase EarP n=1 Tax=Roseateles sp. YR242 TaxID=1855305 RepID=UPI0008C8B68D|nr:elongation factor P maturation arginine rhamnosyltransferase EarP [Roseateles sp. YR242]SEL17366.1 conserved hypothetical protein, PP_1857 family [Roseateles sp. YR242]
MAESPETSPRNAAAPTPAIAQRWDVFCRVIDNHGDLGVCLRLARDLAARGQQVRLWCDNLGALTWMQPTAIPGVQALPWEQSENAAPADVVIETFGCEPPAPYLAAMAARCTAPVWINLEYLSAEDYVERSHGLQSPQFSGPGKGLTKWFFYPGFTTRTGGLLREPGLVDQVQTHQDALWLAERGWGREPGERVLSLFAYPQAPWDGLLDALPGRWRLLLCPGAGQQAVPPRLRPGQRHVCLPYLSQADYDRLLWSCDLNLVRGEDSFVRAQWAGQPMLWQIYFQDDGAHSPKLGAFLDRAWEGSDAALRADWLALNRAWNGLAPWEHSARAALDSLPAARGQSCTWRAKLMEQADLVTQLMGFALGKAGVSS